MRPLDSCPVVRWWWDARLSGPDPPGAQTITMAELFDHNDGRDGGCPHVTPHSFNSSGFVLNSNIEPLTSRCGSPWVLMLNRNLYGPSYWHALSSVLRGLRSCRASSVPVADLSRLYWSVEESSVVFPLPVLPIARRCCRRSRSSSSAIRPRRHGKGRAEDRPVRIELKFHDGANRRLADTDKGGKGRAGAPYVCCQPAQNCGWFDGRCQG